MAKIRKSKAADIFYYVLSLLRISHLKFANVMAILICAFVVWFLNSEHDAAKVANNVVFEWNSMVQRVFNKPYEISSKAKEMVDEALYLNQIRELQERNKVLSERIIHLEIENKEVDKLKALLNLKVSGSYNGKATRIIRASLDYASQSMLVMLGESEGVNNHSFVVDGEALLGKVIEVGSNTSEVAMITNINSRTPVILVDSGMKAVLSGEGGGHMLKISYLSGTDEVVDGEVVVTSGDGIIYPHGIVVGHVRKENSEVFVEPMFSMNELDLVKVYTKQ